MDIENLKLDYLNNLASLKKAEQYFLDNPNAIIYEILYEPFRIKITQGEKLLNRFYEICRNIYEIDKKYKEIKGYSIEDSLKWAYKRFREVLITSTNKL